MLQYLITGRDQSGRQTTECVRAKSAQAALETLQARGWRDLVLHTDDYSAKVKKPQVFGPGHTPGDLVAWQYRGHLANLASQIARMYVIDWKLGALLVAFCSFAAPLRRSGTCLIISALPCFSPRRLKRSGIIACRFNTTGC